MSFQAYLDNIQAKTGMAPDDFRRAAEGKGWTMSGRIAQGVKAGQIVAWLKSDYGLGHGHAMAIYARLKGAKRVHVSLDLDCMDPSVAPGVGTPVKGGLDYREAHLLMESVADSGMMSSLEVVEVNPDFG